MTLLVNSLFRMVSFSLLMVVSQFGLAVTSLIPAPPKLAANAYILIDAYSGEIIVEHNADLPVSPASLTKMMTAYILADEMEKGVLSYDDDVHVTRRAWEAGSGDRSKMFLREGSFAKISDIEKGIIIQSGNDASVAIAEHISGSEDSFADLMNQYAELLDMNNSSFVNASGLPEDNHFSSARDMALLAQAYINYFPEHYKIYSQKQFIYDNVTQYNRNKLLWRDPSVDGMKTGHTDAAGYCLVASAVKNNMRLISVVMGANGKEARARESQKLLTYGFRYFETHKLYSEGEVLNSTKVWAGESDSVDLGLSEVLYITIPRGQHKSLSAGINVDQFIEAPVQAGTEYGNVEVKLNGELLVETSLIALQSVEEADLFKRIWDSITLFFYKLLAPFS